MLQTEQVLGERYQLQQQLGNNAGRQTWLAVNLATQTKEQVIVKLLPLQTAGTGSQTSNQKASDRATIIAVLQYVFVFLCAITPSLLTGVRKADQGHWMRSLTFAIKSHRKWRETHLLEGIGESFHPSVCHLLFLKSL